MALLLSFIINGGSLAWGVMLPSRVQLLYEIVQGIAVSIYKRHSICLFNRVDFTNFSAECSFH